MSSRVIRPDEPFEVRPVSWRLVGGAAAVTPPQVAPAPVQQVGPDIEQRLREAHAAGVREGEAAGRSRATAELNAVLERLAGAIDETARLRARLRREAEGDLVRLALAIARRILRRELAVDPEALHGLVLGALEKLQAQEILRVRVHPAHAGLLRARLEQINATAEIIADSSRELGAVVFETGRGSLDASVESQLREIERGLTDRLNQGK